VQIGNCFGKIILCLILVKNKVSYIVDYRQ
jgi:hypothetical protein